MSVNRGKQFEEQIKKDFERVGQTSVDRLIDPQNGYAGVRNICDFIVYHLPIQYYIECKSVHGNTLSIHSNDPTKKYGMITNNQWEGMLKKSEIKGVCAGVIVWFVDRDETYFLSITLLNRLRTLGYKSVSCNCMKWLEDVGPEYWCTIAGKKKRVLFEYDMLPFLRDSAEWYYTKAVFPGAKSVRLNQVFSTNYEFIDEEDISRARSANRRNNKDTE